MASTPRTVFAAVLTQLANIDGTGSYTYDLSGEDQIQAGRYPVPPRVGTAFLGVALDSLDDDDRVPISVEGYTLGLEVVGFVPVTADTPEARIFAAADLLSDIRRALRTTPRLGLGANVTGLAISGSTFDGDVEDFAPGHGVAVVTVTVEAREAL